MVTAIAAPNLSRSQCSLQALPAYRDAAESRVQNLEAELQERESAFDVNLREQLEKGQAASDARYAIP